MGRQPRIHFPGALFHFTTRGNGGRPIFLSPAHFRTFLGILETVKKTVNFHLFAYCLMTNHIHLPIQVVETKIGNIAGRILTRYSKYFNSDQDTYGHLFQSRYNAFLCQKDSYLLALLHYIHMNPVKAGIAADPSAWPWSSHNAYLFNDGPTITDNEFPLSVFDPEVSKARELYANFIYSDPSKFPTDFFPEHLQADLPSQSFSTKNAGIQNYGGFTPQRPSLDELACDIARSSGVTIRALRTPTKMRTISRARREFSRKAVRDGYMATTVAEFLCCSAASIYKHLKN